ncbi:hypothetical protein RRG08_027684 [Elysia crispata]|uniref:Uncharacterized protein n=1 Tax=Elysia crispata TaxID=231223 RepID=A0AAE0XM94_9GAST|nr:hypothetical protein RRG08_027684 [Elysia crispata]
MSSGGSEDFYSTDEVKVYKDEGNKDEEKRSSENLTEEKLGLVTESEEGKNSALQGNLAGSERQNNAADDVSQEKGADFFKVFSLGKGYGEGGEFLSKILTPNPFEFALAYWLSPPISRARML